MVNQPSTSRSYQVEAIEEEKLVDLLLLSSVCYVSVVVLILAHSAMGILYIVWLLHFLVILTLSYMERQSCMVYMFLQRIVSEYDQEIP